MTDPTFRPTPFLLISPYFPPMGVSGAKRALHMVRHLPRFNYLPLVLAGDPAGESLDPDLALAIPADTVVRYSFSGIVRPLSRRCLSRPARTAQQTPQKPATPKPAFIRSTGRSWRYLTPFDRYLWDVPMAIRAGLDLIKTFGAKAIHVSADPWSGLVAGWHLHQRTGLPLITDLRDPWSVHDAKMALRPWISQQLLRHVEETVFQSSAAIILNTEACREAYVNVYKGRIEPSRFFTVHNAFDGDLFEDVPTQLPSVFTVVYFGRFRQFVGPTPLLRGFAQFVHDLGLLPTQARLRIVGESPENIAQTIADANLTEYVDTAASVPFRKSRGVLQSAHVLALVIEEDCHLQIPGKLFDYLCVQRPILAISANLEANQILHQTRAGIAVSPHNPQAIAHALSQWYTDPEIRRLVYPTNYDATVAFSADAQARKFAAILDHVLIS